MSFPPPHSSSSYHFPHSSSSQHQHHHQHQQHHPYHQAPSPSTPFARPPDQYPFFGSSQPAPGHTTPQPPSEEPKFEIFQWYQSYQSCQRYFLDRAQHSGPVLAVAAFINILLPAQRYPPIISSATRHSPAPILSAQSPNHVSLIPYIRRLVVTGYDNPAILHGFFGDDWLSGVGTLHESERRNYLFAAKSGGWSAVKREYDIMPMETVPFMRPLQEVVDEEIRGAEKHWSEWLAMEDWMVGPRAPEGVGDEMDMGGVGLGLDTRDKRRVKTEDDDGIDSGGGVRTNGR